MNNRITYIGLYAFSLYSLIMSLVFGIIALLIVMLFVTLYVYALGGLIENLPYKRFMSFCKSFYKERNLLGDNKNYENFRVTRFFFIQWRVLLFLLNKKNNMMYTSNTSLEICWTLLPVIILVIIMLPSLVLLYAMDDVSIAFSNVTLKVIGHQWYWSYQHINTSTKLMPAYYNINKVIYLDNNWLSSITKL